MMYSSRHVHRFFAGYPPVFYEGQPSPLGRLSGFFAEVNLLGALSACRGGSCGGEHSSDLSACYPLRSEHYRRTNDELTKADWHSPLINV